MAAKSRWSAASSRRTLSGQLREAIRSSGLTAYAIGLEAEVDPGVVQRFLTNRRDVRLETADRIAAVLGLQLVRDGRKGRTRTTSPLPAEPPVPESPAADEGLAAALE